MRYPMRIDSRHAWARILAALAFSQALLACESEPAERSPSTNSNTNWLVACDDDMDCDPESVCACGVCTVLCNLDSACGDRVDAVCSASTSEAVASLCGFGERPDAGICLAGCQGDIDCTGGATCQQGACAPPPAADTRPRVCDTEGETTCGLQVGLPETTLFACQDGDYVATELCSGTCMSLEGGTGQCLDDACPEIDGEYCGNEIGLADGFVYTCSESVLVRQSGCPGCVPGEGAATCDE